MYVHDRLGSGSVYQWDEEDADQVYLWNGFDQNGNDRKSSNADLGQSFVHFAAGDSWAVFVPNSPDLKNSHLNLVHADKNQRNIENFNERNEDDTYSIVAGATQHFQVTLHDKFGRLVEFQTRRPSEMFSVNVYRIDGEN